MNELSTALDLNELTCGTPNVRFRPGAAPGQKRVKQMRNGLQSTEAVPSRGGEMRVRWANAPPGYWMGAGEERNPHADAVDVATAEDRPLPPKHPAQNP